MKAEERAEPPPPSFTGTVNALVGLCIFVYITVNIERNFERV